MKEYWKALNPILKYFFPVLRNILQQKNQLKQEKSELVFLHALEEYGVQHDHCARIICQILKLLYDADILNEETIIKWNSNPPEDPLALETVRVYVSFCLLLLFDFVTKLFVRDQEINYCNASFDFDFCCRLFQQVQPFIEWLNEAEEETDESD